MKRVKCIYLVFKANLKLNLKFSEYIFIVGGSYFKKTEVVSLSQNVTKLPDCLSNLADHSNEVYYGAGGSLLYDGKEIQAIFENVN